MIEINTPINYTFTMPTPYPTVHREMLDNHAPTSAEKWYSYSTVAVKVYKEVLNATHFNLTGGRRNETRVLIEENILTVMDLY